MAYNRTHYNPDALPAHVEPEQAAAIISGRGDRDRDRDRRSGGGSGSHSKPQPPLPSQSRNDSYNRPPPPPQDRYDDRYNDRYDDPRRPRGGRSGSGGAYTGIGSPPPASYGHDRLGGSGGPGQGRHGRPPIDNYRPPSTNPVAPRDVNDRESLWRMFQTVDRDRSGQLSEGELKNALVNGDWRPFDPHTVRMMIRMFDADRNGSINFDEFCGLWGFLTAWRNLFDRFDADRSGNISLTEFQDALVSFGYRLGPGFVRLLFKTYDRRGENAMSFDLFVQACISLKRMTDVFKKYDEDRDGYITLSFEEFLTGAMSLFLINSVSATTDTGVF